VRGVPGEGGGKGEGCRLTERDVKEVERCGKWEV
jgi:hypothetical protein